ncbi:MAG: hypothetical protein HXX13_14400 [Bacteroidetes bacterium]|nr:hypothetical protein [Bacteroidota bacterium]
MKTHMSFSIWLLFFCLSGVARIDVSYAGSKTGPIHLLTDRSLYVTGEYIRFSASITVQGIDKKETENSILYCELITPGISKLAGGKFIVKEQKSEGCLRIPMELSSGVYYLRAYTQGLRTSGPDHYAYVQIKIVNPLKKELLRSESSIPDTIIHDVKGSPDQAIKISCDKEAYSQNEEISIHVKSNSGTKENFEDMVLTVIPDSSLIIGQVDPISNKLGDLNNINFPDAPGIILSGSIYNQKSLQPLVSRRVNLSILGENDFMAANSDSAGRFFFQLPSYVGECDLFLSSFSNPEPAVGLKIDNDFCILKTTLPAPLFLLSSQEKSLALEMARNVQVETAFHSDPIQTGTTKHKLTGAFYGKPYSILHIDSYIQLPTMEEYFNEIPGAVKIKKKNGTVRFQFTGEQPEMNIYEPLVLIDYVAIDNESVLKIPPQDIDRIELVNSPYIKGSMTYGGIISFFSKKNNFAGIDLPKSGIFIHYSLISEDCIQQTAYRTAHQPDTRNTLLWNPHVEISEANDIRLPAPQKRGRYAVILRGIKKSGEVVSWKTSFEVR